VVSAQFGGTAMEWHFRLGYAVLALLMFRLIWGVIGGHWSRFRSFMYSPAALVNYIKGHRQPEQSIGHNPLGAISVFALLGVLLIQVASGLISDDEIGAAGPLVRLVSSATASLATFYHKDIGKLILISLVVLHIGSILFYWVKKGENLVRPMIQGDKQARIKTKSSRDDGRTRLLALAVWMSCTAFVVLMVKLAGTV
jgi:cytochrome b